MDPHDLSGCLKARRNYDVALFRAVKYINKLKNTPKYADKQAYQELET